MERNPWYRALLILAVAFLSVQLFLVVWRFGAHFATTLLIFFVAWTLSFILNPVVNALSARWRLGRGPAVATVYLAVLLVVVLFGFLLIPPLAHQVSTLGNKVPEYRQNTGQLISDLQEWLDKRHISIDLTQINTSDLNAQIDKAGTQLAQNAVSLAPRVVEGVVDVVIIFIISFYMMLDGPRITSAMISVTPERYQRDVRLLFASIDHSFGGFVRSSALLALIYGGGTAITMWATGIPFAMPVSIFAGLMLVIPFIGDIIAVVPTILIGLVTVSVVNVIIALIALVALQQLVLQILRPRIMGKSVGLHPLWVLAAFFIGAGAAGIWGALFAVPIAAIIQSIVQLYYFRFTGRPQPAALAALVRQSDAGYHPQRRERGQSGEVERLTGNGLPDDADKQPVGVAREDQ